MIAKLKPTLIVFSLLAVLLTACLPSSEDGASATPVPATEPAASLPTDTAAPVSDPAATLAPTEPPATAPVSFANDVMPILQSRCLNCHGGQDTRAGLSIASYDALMAGSSSRAVIIPGDAANSLLVQLIQQGQMPKRGPKLTPEQLQILIDWIMAGALNN